MKKTIFSILFCLGAISTAKASGVVCQGTCTIHRESGYVTYYTASDYNQKVDQCYRSGREICAASMTSDRFFCYKRSESTTTISARGVSEFDARNQLDLRCPYKTEGSSGGACSVPYIQYLGNVQCDQSY